MDATLIAASPSTKNEAGERGPDMSPLKKTTTGKVHDARLTDDLIHPDDTIVFGDKGYVSDRRKRATQARGAT